MSVKIGSFKLSSSSWDVEVELNEEKEAKVARRDKLVATASGWLFHLTFRLNSFYLNSTWENAPSSALLWRQCREGDLRMGAEH